jgi:cytochrome c heme-lyase
MLQQDLLDTLFLNRKALAGVGGGETSGAGNNDDHHHTNDDTQQQPHATEGGSRSTATALTMNKDVGGPDAAGGEKCPVDHRSREAWMAQAKAAQEAQETSAQTTSPPQASKPTSSSTWEWPRIPFLSSSSSSTSPTTTPTTKTAQSLPTQPHGAHNNIDMRSHLFEGEIWIGNVLENRGKTNGST